MLRLKIYGRNASLIQSSGTQSGFFPLICNFVHLFDAELLNEMGDEARVIALSPIA